MRALIESFGAQLREADEIGKSVSLSRSDATHVAVFGLGGSAFGAEVVRNYVYDTLPLPFLIYRGYAAPKHIDKRSMVILSSYSGTTEETLAAAAVCHERGAQIICITSGGAIAEFARANGYPLYQLPTGYPPRSACGFSIVQQLYALRGSGLIPDFAGELHESIEVVENFADHAAAQSLAANLKDKFPVIYSSDAVDSIAIRLRQQINENAKQLCSTHVVPEMNHNELVGWELPKWLLPQTAIVWIKSSYDHPRASIRFDVNSQILAKQTDHIYEIKAKGRSKLAQLFYLLHFSDWVSLFLAEENKVDPTPVKVIDFLKAELATR